MKNVKSSLDKIKLKALKIKKARPRLVTFGIKGTIINTNPIVNSTILSKLDKVDKNDKVSKIGMKLSLDMNPVPNVTI
jgi:hypothetical protein